MENRGTPSITEFTPERIPFQRRVIGDIDFSYNYDLGVHELLCSGSIGSSKTLLASHLVVKHCLRYPRARVAICRLALPDLKKTIFQTIIEHLECSELIEGKDYFVQTSTAQIQFSNKSEIISLYWSDKKFMRIRSINLSAAVIEELTENTGEYWRAVGEVKSRIGRLPIKEKWLVCCTNPDGPSHPAYKYFIEAKNHPTRHVYYSKTEENPYLDQSYIGQLKEDMDPKLARRLLYGEWVEIDKERVYHCYSDSNRIRSKYQINPAHPVILSFDFNIGEGKPMSSCAMQYIEDKFHIFDEVVVSGARTSDSLEEWYGKGYFSGKYQIVIHGDASGDARSTKSVLSDYGIIEKYLANLPGLRFKMEVPRSNPPIRTRHNMVNAYCLNDAGRVRLFIYDGAATVDEALRLTSLKKGGNYVEDDSPSHPEQHIGTALGYSIVYEANKPKGYFEFQARIR